MTQRKRKFKKRRKDQLSSTVTRKVKQHGRKDPGDDTERPRYKRWEKKWIMVGHVPVLRYVPVQGSRLEGDELAALKSSEPSAKNCPALPTLNTAAPPPVATVAMPSAANGPMKSPP